MSIYWKKEDDELMRLHYPEVGAAGMHAKGLLTHRTLKAITNRASDLKVAQQEVPWPVPVHLYTDADRAARKWAGPVNRSPMVWRIAA